MFLDHQKLVDGHTERYITCFVVMFSVKVGQYLHK